ncbi:MAG: glycosyltransferase [Alphaproteobacteria bacterium]
MLHVFPTFAIGGAQRRFAQIANSGEAGFEHHCLAIDGICEAKSLLNAQANVKLVEPASRDGNFLARTSRYRQEIAGLGPDLLITYNWGAIEWAFANLSLGIPHIHMEDGFGREEANHQLLRRVWFRRLVLAKSFAVVVPSQTLETIARKIWKLAPARVRFIPNGIVIPAQSALDAGVGQRRASLGLPVQGVIIGWVGALRSEKNVPRLLRAFAAIKDKATLVLVGDGGSRAETMREIEGLNLSEKVHLLGMRHDIPELLAAFDVLALTSDTEQMPISVLEGMAAGLPIASVDVGDVARMTAPENRRFIVERTESALGEALAELIASPVIRREIGAANRAHASKHYREEQMIKAHLGLLREAVANDQRKKAQRLAS